MQVNKAPDNQESDDNHRVHEAPADYSSTNEATTMLPTYTDAELAGMDATTLVAHLRRHEDRVPRNLIDACAGRGDAMLETLANIFDTPAFWEDGRDDGDWWLRLHAAMILGLIPTAPAGRLLAELMRKLDEAGDEATQDWLAGNWPALFANKPVEVADDLRQLVEDRAIGGYLRVNAMDPYLAIALRNGSTAFETALDWAAELAADEAEDWFVRLNLGNTLLDFPRDRHRELLERLAARQTGMGVHFNDHNVRTAFELHSDKPEWERFYDPWVFYTPDAIANRQRRWEEENREGDEWIADLDDAHEWPETYVREGPKIGRNDPCPCGSGKKYKKCCLGKGR